MWGMGHVEMWYFYFLTDRLCIQSLWSYFVASLVLLVGGWLLIIYRVRRAWRSIPVITNGVTQQISIREKTPQVRADFYPGWVRDLEGPQEI
jgi:hypothetical protein